MNEPKIALILLNYNNAIYLRSCLNSLSSYREHCHEILFVDDCSTDVSTQEYVKILDDFSHLEIRAFFNSNNSGVKRALLNVLDFVNSDYIQLLATDDLFGRFNAVPKFTEDDNDVYISKGLYVDELENIIKPYNNNSLKSPLLTSLLFYSNPIKAPGLIASRRLVKIALLKTDVDFEDWPILRESISRGGKIISSEGAIIYYRQHSKSLSSKLNKERTDWLSSQVMLFLNESLNYEITPYTRLMTRLQIVHNSSGSAVKIVFKLLKTLDFKRLIFTLSNYKTWS